MVVSQTTFCENIQDNDFFVKIFTFEDNALKEKTKTFSGNENGRTIYLYPSQFPISQMPPYGEGIDYEVHQEQISLTRIGGVDLRTTYLGDCESKLSQNTTKSCIITNFLVN